MHTENYTHGIDYYINIEYFGLLFFIYTLKLTIAYKAYSSVMDTRIFMNCEHFPKQTNKQQISFTEI
jgi:hypothetical protein